MYGFIGISSMSTDSNYFEGAIDYFRVYDSKIIFNLIFLKK